MDTFKKIQINLASQGLMQMSILTDHCSWSLFLHFFYGKAVLDTNPPPPLKTSGLLCGSFAENLILGGNDS